jgi:outer membrane protein assembly factor BamB
VPHRAPPTQPPAAERFSWTRWALGVCCGLLLLAASGVWGLEIDVNVIVPLVLGGAALLLLAAVVAGRRGLPLWLRVGTPLAVSLAGAGTIAALRVEYVSGALVPHFTWRWSPKPHEVLAAAPTTLAEMKRPVDLRATTPDDYPQFLGPARVPMLAGPALARDWDRQPPEPLWRQPIGGGWSAFAVLGEYALTQEQRGEEEWVCCYELRTGRLRWRHADRAGFVSVIAGDGPRATPTVHDGRVYTMGATGLLNCLEGATGQVLWRHDVLREHGAVNVEWGKACSPLVADDLVIVSGGGGQGPSLLAFDRITGQPRWTAGEAACAESYSSPALAELCGVRQVLLLRDFDLAAFDPADGRQLWSHPWPAANPKVSQPLVLAGDRVLISTGYGNGCTLIQVVRGDDGALDARELWRSRNLKTKFTNVVVHGDHLYGLDEGILTCLALDSGERAWKAGRYGHGQILLVGDLLLVQCESGEVALVEPAPDELRELTRFAALDGKTWNNPALAGRLLLVRNDREAACYRLPVAGP